MNGQYRNQNPNWQKNYNSILAVPILYQRHGFSQGTLFFGILSIDSHNHQGYELFDETTSSLILSSSADMLALMFGHLDMLQIMVQGDKTIESLKGVGKQASNQGSTIEPSKKIKVFLCHSSVDKPVVRELYRRLSSEVWIDPWLDEEKLLPGQDWDCEIDKAVETSDVVIVCLSNKSVTKEGYIQRELKYALDSALEKPEDTIFVIPLRLEPVDPPRRLRSLQYVDYFPEETRETSYKRLCNSLKLRFERIYPVEL